MTAKMTKLYYKPKQQHDECIPQMESGGIMCTHTLPLPWKIEKLFPIDPRLNEKTYFVICITSLTGKYQSACLPQFLNRTCGTFHLQIFNRATL